MVRENKIPQSVHIAVELIKTSEMTINVDTSPMLLQIITYM